MRKPSSCRWMHAAVLGIAVACGYAGIVFGQGNLATLPGLTEVQQPTATAVNVACVQFGPNGFIANAQGTLAERLYYTCRVMVQTANQLAGAKPGTPPTANSLNISNDELRTGVQAVAPVQMNAQKQISTEASKNGLLTSRLLDLRSGARGFVVSENGVTAPADGSYSASSKGLDGATGGGAAADADGRLGGFVNFGYNWGNVDRTTLQDAYDYRSFSLLTGLDYRVSESLVLGAAFSYNDTHSTYDLSLGSVKARTLGVAGYGTYYSSDWYADGFIAYGSVDYDSVRNIFILSNNKPAVPDINTSATASPKGNQWSASLGVGRSFARAPYTFTPSLRLAWIQVNNDSFNEIEPINGLGLAVSSRKVESLQTALGGKIATTISTSTGVFVPYFTANWMHEFKNESPSIISKYVSDPFNTVFAIPSATPTRDYGVLTLGSSLTLPNNYSAFAQIGTAVGLQNETNYGLVVGLRMQF